MSGANTIATAPPSGLRAHTRLIAIAGAVVAIAVAFAAAYFVSRPTSPRPVETPRVVVPETVPVSPRVAEHADLAHAKAGQLAWGLRYQGQAQAIRHPSTPVSHPDTLVGVTVSPNALEHGAGRR